MINEETKYYQQKLNENLNIQRKMKGKIPDWLEIEENELRFKIEQMEEPT